MPIPAENDRSCSAPTSGATVSLPVLGVQQPKLRKSKMGRIRAGVLIAVHVAIIAHIIYWLASGRKATLSPVEPSEAIYTLQNGAVNAGFVLFVIAILATLVLGRWFCGWACHIVALQDLCGWMMKKMGVRPKPFRARLLLYAPLALALYMFVWPTLLREAIAPAAKWAGAWAVLEPYVSPDLSSPFPAPVFHSGGAGLAFFRPEFTKTDFWETFPREWYIIVPFLGVCGFAMVYFLGSKGFCTYGCPYGGFFAPADKVALGRIRVTDACHHCGHCTAACTSNVRVHEEVRDYGMVVDPGCMKCLDCVSVCPNDALYFGLGRPAAFAQPTSAGAGKKQRFKTRVYDLSRGEELAVSLVFLGMLVAFRGMFDKVPLLMAVGMAGVGAFLAWKLWALVKEPSVRVQSLQLKLKGRVRPAGVIVALLSMSTLAMAGWSGVVRYSHWRAGVLDARVDQSGVSFREVFSPGYTPDPRVAKRARAAVGLFAIGLSPDAGGIGWARSAAREIEVQRRMAWLSAVAGDWQAARKHLIRGIEHADADPAVSIVDLAEGLVQIAANESRPLTAAIADLQEVARRAPRVFEIHLLLAQMQGQAGLMRDAVQSALAAAAALESISAQHPQNPQFFALRGRALAFAGQLTEAEPHFRTAAELAPHDPGFAAAYAQVLGALGRHEDAAVWQRRAQELAGAPRRP